MSRTQQQPNSALQIIFSFFLGLMVLAFIGIGVNTFYPSPMQRYDEELQDLYRQQERYSIKGPLDELTEAEQAEYQAIQDQINEIMDKQRVEQESWARNTSIILITFATLVMAISLIRSEQLRVISNGLLLGGLFTMVYGVGWVIFSGESAARFFVILVAFAITVALGYLKFVRERAEAVTQVASSTTAGAIEGAPGASELLALEARIRMLEERTSAAAAALGSKDD